MIYVVFNCIQDCFSILTPLLTNLPFFFFFFRLKINIENRTAGILQRFPDAGPVCISGE